jgi:UDP-2-acetamido-2,6-beta-L-arabino-hexul-4-ose reductase
MRILITGSNGFIAKNLILRLGEMPDVDILEYNTASSVNDLERYIHSCEFIFHLAGVNRPVNDADFLNVNGGLTKRICEISAKTDQKPSIIFPSSTQAGLDNEYGKSKVIAEKALQSYAKKNQAKIFIYRLPSVMGKWCRPDYNSVVATFCHNIANDKPITINNAETLIELIYIDDVVNEFIRIITENPVNDDDYMSVNPIYEISLGKLSEYLYGFRKNRKDLFIDEVGSGFLRALYSTFISYYSKNEFSYEIPFSTDERGTFVEMLKTGNSGQMSFFTCHPGLTRGSHYHHTKTEKFLVVQGNAKFRFRNLLDDYIHEIDTSSQQPEIVESIPGWVHDVTNTGNDELIVMIWANEIFDKKKSDTVYAEVNNG